MNERNMDVIEKTWEELGRRVKDALGRTVFVRTDAPTDKTDSGVLWLPPKQQGFYGGLPTLPHKRIVKGTVLVSGPDAEVQPGDRICFQRLDFAWLWKLKDGAYVGYIDEMQIALVGTDDGSENVVELPDIRAA